MTKSARNGAFDRKFKKYIVFTGGGTAGHVTPNIALIKKLDPKKYQIAYIGSDFGIEKNLITILGIPYYSIKTGKLRRYFSWRNFIDPIYIFYGILQAFFLLRRLQVDLVFSKGGFVGFPVVIGAWLNRIPIIAHESDLTPGLANRLSFPFVKHIFLTFDKINKHFIHSPKAIVTGSPLREELFSGAREKGLKLCNFSVNKPVLLVIGGSQGAQQINQVLRESLDFLCLSFQVIHLCGRDKLVKELNGRDSYIQFEYINEEMADLFAASDVIISRAGSNSLYEILSLRKPHILIPLGHKNSRGDQVYNAQYFAERGVSFVINEEDLTREKLVGAVEKIFSEREKITQLLTQLNIKSGTQKIINLINHELNLN